jgi:hypothetical protein
MIKVDDSILVAEFIKAIRHGDMTIEQVPEKYKEEVEKHV